MRSFKPSVTTNQPENMKEKNARAKIPLSFRSKDHFYKIVNYLNTELGKGEQFWTMAGRPLRRIKATGHAESVVYIYVDHPPEFGVYLSLL